MNSHELITTIIEIWVQGGWLMFPLALLALCIYLAGFELVFFFRKYGFDKDDKNTWGHWIDKPEDGTGMLGAAIRFAQEGSKQMDSIRSRVHELRHAYINPARRRIYYLSILVTVAPLTGLLGTVIGMIVTFNGLSSSRGSALDVVAGGISQALITTQTGLIIAIPGYILVHHAKTRCQRLEGFFSELEIRTAQKFERTHKES
ncbi:MAG TPA: hypothetical protein DEA90_06855 [Opitutae bacterium]|nr:hypothetical protein [Puniceicoccaceae bacterium]HBR93869.1 hypothetical protein [Opitutae bacterium]|tara:strand:- start:83 stop:691 length:609 start_codon:yes stop_codon:yes gene_type:complete